MSDLISHLKVFDGALYYFPFGSEDGGRAGSQVSLPLGFSFGLLLFSCFHTWPPSSSSVVRPIIHLNDSWVFSTCISLLGGLARSQTTFKNKKTKQTELPLWKLTAHWIASISFAVSVSERGGFLIALQSWFTMFFLAQDPIWVPIYHLSIVSLGEDGKWKRFTIVGEG